MASQGPKKALNVVVFLGSVREHNMGSRAAKFVGKTKSLVPDYQLASKGHTVKLLDPEELDLPLLKKAFHHYQDRSQAPKILQDTNQIIVDADAYIVLTAEYNHCMPPALTNMMDHFPGSSYKWKPSGIVSYSMGSFGGARAAMQVRCLLGELGSPSIGYILTIPTIQNQFSKTGEPQNDRMTTNADKFITELEWWAEATRNQRDSVGVPQ